MEHKIKQEPEDPPEEPAEEDFYAAAAASTAASSSQPLTNMEIVSSVYETIKDAASANTKPNRAAHAMEKKRKPDKFDDYDDDDYPRSDMCPDRTMSDFYCKICDAHMNSEQMWESHVSGKRHLKNVKKEPGEMPSKVKAIKVQDSPKLMEVIKTVHEPLVGLGFMTELQRADPVLNPSYTCHLCQANCTWSVVIEHILTTKHRLAYLKAVDPEQYDMIENMELKKTALDQLAEDRAREYERKRGCGTMEVKLEKPKVAPPLPRREKPDDEVSSVGHYSRSLSSESRYERKPSPDEYRGYSYSRSERSRSPPSKYRHVSPLPLRRKRRSPSVDGKWRHDRFSPDGSPPVHSHASRALSSSTPSLPCISALSPSQKLSVLKEIADEFIVVTEDEMNSIKSVIINLSSRILQFKIRSMPSSVQNQLARHIVRGETNNLEEDLLPFLDYIYDTVSSPFDNNGRQHRRSSSSHSRRRH